MQFNDWKLNELQPFAIFQNHKQYTLAIMVKIHSIYILLDYCNSGDLIYFFYRSVSQGCSQIQTIVTSWHIPDIIFVVKCMELTGDLIQKYLIK